ncbi:hypothetical protein Fmac_021380 [Flemingia macrophylla]|uniref:Terpene synthase metal-binding domain-containing protein n=1 Tax=Flemingia macrophylla TaxID=520843 RepID=A0ABD1LWP9_9FABA
MTLITDDTYDAYGTIDELELLTKAIERLTRKLYKKFVRAYNTETRWLNDNYKPTIEEYLEISTISASYSLLTITSYIGMRYITTENIFKWATNEPKIVKAANITSRLMDDIVSNEPYIFTGTMHRDIMGMVLAQQLQVKRSLTFISHYIPNLNNPTIATKDLCLGKIPSKNQHDPTTNKFSRSPVQRLKRIGFILEKDAEGWTLASSDAKGWTLA